MTIGQCKNTVNISQGNMVPPEPSYPATGSPRHSNTVDTQENDFKLSLTKMIETLKEEMNKSFKEIQEMNKTVKDLKMEIEAIKKTQLRKSWRWKI